MPKIGSEGTMTYPMTPFLCHSLNEGKKRRRSPRSHFPAYLYLRDNIYYFRYAFSFAQQRHLGRPEIRFSLCTPYLRLAKERAQVLRHELLKMARSGMDYETLRLKLNGLLRAILEQEDKQLCRPALVDVPGIGVISQADYYNRLAYNFLLPSIDTPEGLASFAPEVVAQLIQLGIISEDEIQTKQDALLVTKAYMKMVITRDRILKSREEGDFLAEQAAFIGDYIPLGEQQTASASCVTPQQAAPSPGSQYSLSQIIEKYIESKVSDSAWRKNSIVDHRNRLNFLLEIIGDKQLSAIHRGDMRDFREKLRRLPPNMRRTKKYKDKSVDEILAMEPQTVLNLKTVNIITDAASSLFEWCCREEILTSNPAKGLQIKDERQEIELKDAFTNDDIQNIFLSKRFITNDFVNIAYFWVPLIGLFSGMRLEEICQLHVADVYQTEGVWVMDVNAKANNDRIQDKQVKNKNAVRLVPIHSQLVTLGFLEYHAKVQKNGDVRLFPKLNKTEKSKYGKQVGKSFSAVIKDVGIKGKKSFHSLRHTFADFFKQNGLQDDMFRQVYGHEIPALASKQYGAKFGAAKCSSGIIERLEYGVDLSELVGVGIHKRA